MSNDFRDEEIRTALLAGSRSVVARKRVGREWMGSVLLEHLAIGKYEGEGELTDDLSILVAIRCVHRMITGDSRREECLK